MLDKAERESWLEEVRTGRGLVTPDPILPSSLTVSHVTFAEAQQAWIEGLYVATVLCAHAACETTLGEKFARAKVASQADEHQILDWDELVGLTEAAEAEAKEFSGGGEPRRRLADLGQPVPSGLSRQLQRLAGHRNDLTHFRPSLKVVTDGGHDGQTIITFDRAEVVLRDTHIRWAKHAITTMFDLWSPLPLI